jgi:hypothetical protein
MSTPIAPFVFGAIGLGALVRGLFRPHRAVAKKGVVRRCEGANQFGVCDPTIVLNVEDGTPVYATAAGKVVAVGDDFVHIVLRKEAAIQLYQGIVPDVVEGQHVGKGQVLGASTGVVSFGVWQLVPASGGGVLMQNVPPSAWMAARGVRPFVKNLGDESKWCEGGRSISVPSKARQTCNFKKPDPAMFALLPVQIELEG